MWWTPDGERILQGAEGRLFRDALGMIVDMVRDDAEGLWQFGAPPFDKLQPNQKLAVLAEVGSALLCEDQSMPRLTAGSEATMGTVYEVTQFMVEMEIDQSPSLFRLPLLGSHRKTRRSFFCPCLPLRSPTRPMERRL